MGGGLDSSALVPLLQAQHNDVEGIHFDYGQPAAERELVAVRVIARHYDVQVRSELIRPSLPLSPTGFAYRNAQLALAAAALAEPPSLVALGIHAGTPFYDCSPRFFEALRGMVGDYSQGRVRLVAPWLSYSKRDIVQYALGADLPVSATYSCQTGRDPCRTCLSCRDREVLLESA